MAASKSRAGTGARRKTGGTANAGVDRQGDGTPALLPPVHHQNAPIIFADSIGTFMLDGNIVRLTLTTDIDMMAPDGTAFTQQAVVAHLRLQYRAAAQIADIVARLPLLAAPVDETPN